MAGKELDELLVSSEVQTARDRLEDYDAAETAADNNPRGEQELEDLRQALVDMPGAVRMLLEAIDRAGRACEVTGEGHDLTVDHIIPESLKGPNCFSNARLTSMQFNVQRGNTTQQFNYRDDTWRREMLKKLQSDPSLAKYL